jgi:sulfonate transport system substrate-binding protein
MPVNLAPSKASLPPRLGRSTRLTGWLLMRRLKPWLSLIALFALSSTSACTKQRLEVINIGIPGVIYSSGKPIKFLYETEPDRFLKEEFKADNVRIQWHMVPSGGPGLNEGLASGAFDFVYYGDFPAVIGKAEGIDTKLVLPGSRGQNSYLVVAPDSTATSLADLKGKRVTFTRGRPNQLAFDRLATSSGLKESDFQIINMPAVDGDAALAAHGVDAVFGAEGYLLEKKHIGRIIWSTRDKPLDWNFTAELFVLTSFRDRYPEATARVVKAFLRTSYFVSLPENRAEVLQQMTMGYMPYDVVVQEYRGLPLKNWMIPVFDPFVRAHYQGVIDYMLKNKMIRTGFSVDHWFDPSFADAALKDLKLENYWPRADAEGRPLVTSATATEQASSR